VAAKDGNARVACVIGDPIAHSLSPRIHEYWLAQHDINGAYIPLRVRPDRFDATMDMLFESGCVGMNVTLPHKRAAYDYAHVVDEVASQARAVNTLMMRDGVIYGKNSDAFGFMLFWEESVRNVGIESPKRVLLLGAGGAAAAIICALRDVGCHEVVIANRTQANAQMLIDQLRYVCPTMQLSVCGLEDVARLLPSMDALVNSIAIGALKEEDYRVWLEDVSMNLLVLDASYARYGTPLTRYAQKRGFYAYDGLPMLVWQAVIGFEAWFDVRPEVDDKVYALLRSETR
jgi:shikimate dehydrogenase